MNFSSLTKKVNENNYKEMIIKADHIKAQYNPNRFKFWKALHEGPENEVLNMLYSPHYRFLNQYKQQNIKDTSYYKLQKLYGRNDKWIKDKIKKFIELFEDIKKNGCKEKIIILPKPLVKNVYNNNFEIFEGHHRITCLLIIDLTKISCKVIGR